VPLDKFKGKRTSLFSSRTLLSVGRTCACGVRGNAIQALHNQVARAAHACRGFKCPSMVLCQQEKEGKTTSFQVDLVSSDLLCCLQLSAKCGLMQYQFKLIPTCNHRHGGILQAFIRHYLLFYPSLLIYRRVI
jgi:hypothetical protein